MNQTNQRHVYTVMLILLLAFGTMGIAYGQWVENLTITGSVSTAEFDVEWLDFDCYDKENLASVDAVLLDDEDLDQDTIQITVTNGYPGYTGTCWANSLVLGDIPVIVDSIGFLPGSNLTGCVTNHDPLDGDFSATCDQLQIEWTNGVGTILNPNQVGGDVGVSANWRLRILDEVLDATTYGFTVTYTYNQHTP